MNQSFFAWLFGFSNKSAIFDAVIVFGAKYLPYILVLGAIIFFFGEERGKRRRLFLICEAVLAVVLSRGILTEIFRFFYHHPRPFDVLGFISLVAESGNSFPSGHGAFFFALAMSMFFFNKKWGTIYFILAILNGLARVLAGVHWPADILGGVAVGVMSAFIVHKLVLPYRDRALVATAESNPFGLEHTA